MSEKGPVTVPETDQPRKSEAGQKGPTVVPRLRPVVVPFLGQRLIPFNKQEFR